MGGKFWAILTLPWQWLLHNLHIKENWGRHLYGKVYWFYTQSMSIWWIRKWQPTQVFLPGKVHGKRSLEGYSPWVYKELDMTEHDHNKYSGCLIKVNGDYSRGEGQSPLQTYPLASNRFGSDSFLFRALCIYVQPCVLSCQKFLVWEGNIKPWGSLELAECNQDWTVLMSKLERLIKK